MQRYKLTIAYRGTRYHGWQQQPMLASYKGEKPAGGVGIPTIQATLAKAVVSVVNHPVVMHGSSRTDAGVHAKGQIVHFDTDQTQIPIEGMRLAINARLPEDIVVRSIEPVDRSFDAIRSTRRKRYQYVIRNASDRSPFSGDLAWHRWQPLDVAAMVRGAAHLIGEHDFASFSKPKHGRAGTVRTIYKLPIVQRPPLIVFGIEGNGFLWQMIRIIVGTLVEVGMGNRDADVIATMLAAKDRTAAGPTAPAHGLYLQWIQTTEKSESASESTFSDSDDCE